MVLFSEFETVVKYCYEVVFYPDCCHLLYALGWQSMLRHPHWKPIPA
jgi:hypothetical protein